MNPVVPEIIAKIAHTLELSVSEIPKQSGSHAQNVAEMQQFKEALKKHYRVLAKKWHPDMPTGDVERMQAINNLYDQFMAYVVPPPQPAVRVVFGFGYGGATATATSATTAGFGGFSARAY